MVMLLGATGRVYIRSEVATEGGGEEYVFTAGSDLPCRIAPIGGGEGGLNPGDQINERTTHVVTLPAYTEVSEKDRFEVDDFGMYEVTAVRRRTFDELVRRVECIEMAQEASS